MPAGTTQEGTSDGAYSRINPPYPEMIENRSGKAGATRRQQISNAKRIADLRRSCIVDGWRPQLELSAVLGRNSGERCGPPRPTTPPLVDRDCSLVTWRLLGDDAVSIAAPT